MTHWEPCVFPMLRASVCSRFPALSRTNLRMRACEGGSSGGGLQNRRPPWCWWDARACWLPLNQLPSILQSRICLLVPARGKVMYMEPVRGLSEEVPTCGLVVCLSHTWKALCPSQLLLLLLILWENHVWRFSVSLRVSGVHVCVHSLLIQSCPETLRKWVEVGWGPWSLLVLHEREILRRVCPLLLSLPAPSFLYLSDSPPWI